MTDTENIPLPRVIATKLPREAERVGLTIEEYLLEILSQSGDPREGAREYIEAAEELLEHAKVELERNNIRQAAEKIWGAAALAIKAYAMWSEGKRLSSHGELWTYKSVIAKEIGSWVYSSWNAANSMRTCFYEGWCGRDDIENALEEVERLVKAIDERIRGRNIY